MRGGETPPDLNRNADTDSDAHSNAIGNPYGDGHTHIRGPGEAHGDKGGNGNPDATWAVHHSVNLTASRQPCLFSRS